MPVQGAEDRDAHQGRRPDAADDLRGCPTFDAVTALRVRDLQLPARGEPRQPRGAPCRRRERWGRGHPRRLRARNRASRAPPEPDMATGRYVTPVACPAGFRPTKRQPPPGTRKLRQGPCILNVAETHARAIRARTERKPEYG